jgi:hypothetical protein
MMMMFTYIVYKKKVKTILNTNQPIRLKDENQMKNNENNLPKNENTAKQKNNQVSTA